MNSPNKEAKEIYYTCLNIGDGYLSDYIAGKYANFVVQKLKENGDVEYYKKVEKSLKKLLNYKS